MNKGSKQAARKAPARKSARKRSGGGRGGGPGGGRGGGRGGKMSRGRSAWRTLVRALVLLAFFAGLWTASWVVEMDRIVVDRFEGQRFIVPSKVFSAPGILYPGLDVELSGTAAAPRSLPLVGQPSPCLLASVRPSHALRIRP
ncbi:MAG: hypothetical protein JRG89_16950 [Deltaproteobacteria bacterium]|nr:hypothetical protein [Deltaproteobacteria bacterium]